MNPFLRPLPPWSPSSSPSIAPTRGPSPVNVFSPLPVLVSFLACPVNGGPQTLLDERFITLDGAAQRRVTKAPSCRKPTIGGPLTRRLQI